MGFELRVWNWYGGDSEAVRGLHLGHRQGNAKKGGGRLKVLIFLPSPALGAGHQTAIADGRPRQQVRSSARR